MHRELSVCLACGDFRVRLEKRANGDRLDRLDRKVPPDVRVNVVHRVRLVLRDHRENRPKRENPERRELRVNLELLEPSVNEDQLVRRDYKVSQGRRVQLERLVRREIVARWD